MPTLEGQWEQLAIRRLGPWSVELDPFPFAGEGLELEIECVHIERPRFGSTEELQALFESSPRDSRTTMYEPAKR